MRLPDALVLSSHQSQIERETSRTQRKIVGNVKNLVNEALMETATEDMIKTNEKFLTDFEGMSNDIVTRFEATGDKDNPQEGIDAFIRTENGELTPAISHFHTESDKILKKHLKDVINPYAKIGITDQYNTHKMKSLREVAQKRLEAIEGHKIELVGQAIATSSDAIKGAIDPMNPQGLIDSFTDGKRKLENNIKNLAITPKNKESLFKSLGHYNYGVAKHLSKYDPENILNGKYEKITETLSETQLADINKKAEISLGEQIQKQAIVTKISEDLFVRPEIQGYKMAVLTDNKEEMLKWKDFYAPYINENPEFLEKFNNLTTELIEKRPIATEFLTKTEKEQRQAIENYKHDPLSKTSKEEALGYLKLLKSSMDHARSQGNGIDAVLITNGGLPLEPINTQEGVEVRRAKQEKIGIDKNLTNILSTQESAEIAKNFLSKASDTTKLMAIADKTTVDSIFQFLENSTRNFDATTKAQFINEISDSLYLVRTNVNSLFARDLSILMNNMANGEISHDFLYTALKDIAIIQKEEKDNKGEKNALKTTIENIYKKAEEDDGLKKLITVQKKLYGAPLFAENTKHAILALAYKFNSESPTNDYDQSVAKAIDKYVKGIYSEQGNNWTNAYKQVELLPKRIKSKDGMVTEMDPVSHASVNGALSTYMTRHYFDIDYRETFESIGDNMKIGKADQLLLDKLNTIDKKAIPEYLEWRVVGDKLQAFLNIASHTSVPAEAKDSEGKPIFLDIRELLVYSDVVDYEPDLKTATDIIRYRRTPVKKEYIRTEKNLTEATKAAVNEYKIKAKAEAEEKAEAKRTEAKRTAAKRTAAKNQKTREQVILEEAMLRKQRNKG